MFNLNKKYNILVLGNNGMLGYELYERLLELSKLKKSNIGKVFGIDIKDGIDLSKQYPIENFFENSIHFDYCINCVAYTNTNAAQNTKEGRELDYKLNALAPKYIAETCKQYKTKLIHISTDYVFSEKSVNAAWCLNNSPLKFKPEDEPFPCNIYGYDKLLGEMNIKEIFGKNNKDYCIMRVSWLYGMHNNKSFIHKFIANLVKTVKEGKTEVEMTLNEYSIPTSCAYVFDCILNIINKKISGIYHAVPVCIKDPTKDYIGVSRYDFANEILKFLKHGNYAVSEDDVDFSKIKLIGVERNSYWPIWSVLKSSVAYSTTWDVAYSTTWDDCLRFFLNNNIYDILKWAKT